LFCQKLLKGFLFILEISPDLVNDCGYLSLRRTFFWRACESSLLEGSYLQRSIWRPLFNQLLNRWLPSLRFLSIFWSGL